MSLYTGRPDAGLWTLHGVGRRAEANPYFSGVRFLDLNVELLLELSPVYLHFSAYPEVSCVKCEQLSCAGHTRELDGEQSLRSCLSPLQTLQTLLHCPLSQNSSLEMLPDSLRAPCGPGRGVGATKLAQVMTLVPAPSLPVTDKVPTWE